MIKTVKLQSSINPKPKKHKITRHILLQVLKTNDKEILKAARGKKHFQYSEIRIADFTLQKCNEMTVVQYYHTPGEKKGVDLSFYTWQKYISKKYFFRHTKAEKNFISNTALQPLQ